MVAGRQHGGDGAALLDDMSRGTEAYLQMWERSIGIAPDSCRNPGLRLTVSQLRSKVRPGMTTTRVMREVGQPFRRLGTEYGVCARTADAQPGDDDDRVRPGRPGGRRPRLSYLSVDFPPVGRSPLGDPARTLGCASDVADGDRLGERRWTCPCGCS